MEEETTLIRMLWVRHGLSCANVLDECVQNAEEIPTVVNDSSWRQLVEGPLKSSRGHSGIAVEWEWGVKPRGWMDQRGDRSADCAVRLKGLAPESAFGTRKAEALGNDGDVIRLHDLFQDPSLTTCSVHQSKKAGEALEGFLRNQSWTLDLVGSSTLLRAAQTSYHMFVEGESSPNGRLSSVVQLPYIDERAPAAMTSVQLDNLPASVADQRRRLGVHSGPEAHKAVDGSLVSSKAVEKILRGRPGAYPRGSHDFDKFKAFAALDLLPQLLSKAPKLAPDAAVAAAIEGASGLDAASPGLSVRARRTGKQVTYRQLPAIDHGDASRLEATSRVVTLAIVGHGAMIRKHCLAEATRKESEASRSGVSVDGRVEPKVGANNNAVYEKLMVVKKRRRGNEVLVTLSEAAGDCALVMDAPPRADSMARTEASDLESCDKPFDIRPFLKLVASDPGVQGPSSCEAAADAPGAFPILYEAPSCAQGGGS